MLNWDTVNDDLKPETVNNYTPDVVILNKQDTCAHVLTM